MQNTIRLVPLIIRENCSRNICRFRSAKDLNKFQSSQFQQFANYFSSTSTAKNKSNIISPDFIVNSSYPTIEAVTGVTIPELIWSDLPNKENAPGLECASTGKKYTHGDIYRQSRSFATSLMNAGVKRNDVVAILLLNCPEYSTTLLGIWESGGIACTINPSYTEDEFANLLKLSKPKVIVTSPEFLPTVRKAQKSCPSLKNIIVTGPPQDGCHTFDEMIKTDSTGANFLRGSEINSNEQVAVLPFSSGTTGLPKAVQLTHSNICSNLLQYTAPDFSVWRKLVRGEEQDRLLGVLPIFHMAGLIGGLANHLLGCNKLLIPKFTPEVFVNSMKRHKPTVLTIVPTLVSFVTNTPDLTRKDFEPVRCVQSGAAPCGIALAQKLFEKMGKEVFFQEVYGLTETSPFSTIMNPSRGNSKLGSCGSLVPGTMAKVIDVDSGKCLGPNGNGEVCIKGPQIMKGYLDNEEATRKTVDSEGWLHSGDIGYYDEDGYFYIVDRLKDLIKVNGLQVAPAELEDEIRKLPDVAEVAVIGIPDERAGELPRAYIVRKSRTLTESAVNDFLEEKIAKYKQLKGGIEFLEALPKSAVGKVLRRDLRQNYISKTGKSV